MAAREPIVASAGHGTVVTRMRADAVRAVTALAVLILVAAAARSRAEAAQARTRNAGTSVMIARQEAAIDLHVLNILNMLDMRATSQSYRHSIAPPG
jgi:hypothetical protein